MFVVAGFLTLCHTLVKHYIFGRDPLGRQINLIILNFILLGPSAPLSVVYLGLVFVLLHKHDLVKLLRRCLALPKNPFDIHRWPCQLLRLFVVLCVQRWRKQRVLGGRFDLHCLHIVVRRRQDLIIRATVNFVMVVEDGNHKVFLS